MYIYIYVYSFTTFGVHLAFSSLYNNKRCDPLFIYMYYAGVYGCCGSC